MFQKSSLQIDNILSEITRQAKIIERFKSERERLTIEHFIPRGELKLTANKIEFLPDIYPPLPPLNEMDIAISDAQRELLKLFAELFYSLELTASWATITLAMKIMYESPDSRKKGDE